MTTPIRPIPNMGGGRVSHDSNDQYGGIPSVIVAPLAPDQRWSLQTLDANALSTLAPAKLLDLLADLSPELSRALWDYTRLCNPGWEAVTMRPGTDTPDTAAQPALDAYIGLLGQLYGSIDAVWNRLFLSAFLRGAFLGELVLDEAGRVPVDFATPDVSTIRFRRVIDPVRGLIYEMGQWQGGKWVSLDRPTIAYIPIDPFPGAPYGRPIASPALFSCVFLLGLLHDLRRIIAHQGYPRMDISILSEKLTAVMPPETMLDGDSVKAWVDAAVQQVIDAYSGLQPDDAYVHLDTIQLNPPVGTVDANSLGGLGPIIDTIVAMCVRALKTMPLMMGITDGVSEANANRQWEIQAAGIKALQHHAEQLLERLLTLALTAQGIATSVQFRFSELRASEELRDQQTLQLKIANAQALYAMGVIGQDEVAALTVGHPPDQDEPRAVAAPPPPDDAQDVNPEPGADRVQPNGWRITTIAP